MKLILSILIIFAISFSALAQDKDTINKFDENNLKQGYWIKFDNTNTKKIEEGRFIDDKKEDIWITYYPDSKIKSEITYKGGKPNGYAKFYYENGKISEEGIWKGTKWTGSYKYFYENGNTKYDWKYTEGGKRTGEQKYFHENGNLSIVGNWQDGKEAGVIKEYGEDGKLLSEKTFENGKLDESSVRNYAEANHNNVVSNNTTKPTKDTTNVIINDEIVYINSETMDNALKAFDGNGFHKLYKNNLIDREGEFKDSRLINGKRYYYSPSGKLERTCIYKNARVVNIIYAD